MNTQYSGDHTFSIIPIPVNTIINVRLDLHHYVRFKCFFVRFKCFFVRFKCFFVRFKCFFVRFKCLIRIQVCVGMTYNYFCTFQMVFLIILCILVWLTIVLYHSPSLCMSIRFLFTLIISSIYKQHFFKQYILMGYKFLKYNTHTVLYVQSTQMGRYHLYILKISYGISPTFICVKTVILYPS